MDDILGNYVGSYDDSDTPVTDQKQATQDQVDQSAQAAQTQAQAPIAPTTTSATGSVAPATTPAGPVAPNQPVSALAAVPKQPDYNTYTAINESGNNPNIGYHDLSKGTAYGTYGLTNAAYTDIQKMDPIFQNRPITSLTPAEQTRANEDYKTILQQQLQTYGVDPSEDHIRLAHFLGAKGAADYLKTGAVSPAAAAANGGVDRVQAIAQGRLAGTTAPASGALLAPSHAEQFVQATQDPSKLSAVRNDPTAPVGFRLAATDQDYERMSNQQQITQAQSQLAQMARTNDWTGLSDQLKSDTNEGSIFRAMFYQQAGLADLAKQEQLKLGAGRTWQTVDLGNGQQGVVQVGADGAPIKGYTASGPMDPDQLVSAVGITGANSKTAVTQAQQAAANLGEILRKQEADGFRFAPGEINARMRQAYNQTYQSLMSPHAGPMTAPSPVLTATTAQSQLGVPQQPGSLPAQGPQVPGGQAQAAVQPGQVEPGQVRAPAPPSVADRIARMKSQLPGDTYDTWKKRTDALANVDAQSVEDVAQQIANYQIRPSSLNRGQAFNQLVMSRVQELNPTYSTGRYEAANRTETAFATGQQGNQVRSASVALDHLQQLKELTNGLENTNVPMWNRVKNEYATATGEVGPSNFDAAKRIVADEVMKTIVAGGGGQHEREALQHDLNNAKTPKQLAGVIDQWSGLMAAQLKGLKTQYTAAGLPGANFDDKLSDRARVLMGAHQDQPLTGKTSTNVPYRIIQ